MKNIDLVYRYLQKYSDKSIEKFCKLFHKPDQNGKFTAEDIPHLCDILLKIESELEDEHSYNIDWPLKDYILDTILRLAVQSKDDKWIDVIVEAMNRFRNIHRPYLEHANEVIISEFLFGELNENSQTVAIRRASFLNSLKTHISDYKQMLNNFCLDYIQLFEQRIQFEIGVNRDALEKSIGVAQEILSLLKNSTSTSSSNI